MLRSWRLLSGHSCRKYTHSNTRAGFSSGVLAVLSALDKDNAKLLSIINKRIEERNRLVAQVVNGGPTSPVIQHKKRLKSLDMVYDTWCTWQKTRRSIIETASLLEDEDPSIRALAAEEYQSLFDAHKKQLTSTFPLLLVPQSQTSDMSALIEIKPGVGGSESSLFLADLLRMYTRFGNLRGWSSKIITKEDRDGGGMKNATLEVIGDGVYDLLRWESGVHRVQRVPATESSGRVHTSTVQIIVLPLSESSNLDTGDEKLYEEKDVKVDVMRARGAGGQHVNKTESAVRLTHIPTGITVSMQDERSQHTNKARAFQVLRARLLDRKLQIDITNRRETRRQLVRSASRSEKIRTYNFVQDRITDHRIGWTSKNLTSVIDGPGLQQLLDAITTYYRQELIEDVLD
ncbi:release factor, partial [Phellopilus nigrolimitatus]